MLSCISDLSVHGGDSPGREAPGHQFTMVLQPGSRCPSTGQGHQDAEGPGHSPSLIPKGSLWGGDSCDLLPPLPVGG